MKHIFIFNLIQFYLSYVHLFSSQSSQHALFSLIPNSIYIPQFSSSFLINLTDNTIINENKCAQRCLQYDKCQTAVYNRKKQVCSLFYEQSSIGQIVSQMNETSIVITMKNREPKNCMISSQSTWLSNSTVIIGDPNGNLGTSLSRLSTPTSIYYDQSTRDLIVGDRNNYRIIKFSLKNQTKDGIILAGSNGYGCNLNQFQSIQGAIVDSSRQLFVIDLDCSRLVKFPANSNSTTYGQLIKTMNQPQSITIDHRTDDIYVAGSSDRLVMKFTKNNTIGVIVAGNNGWGSNLNQLTNTYGVHFDDLTTNSLYVSDWNNCRVLKFPINSTNNTFGVRVAGNGTCGAAINQLSMTGGVIVDINGIVYVADTGNGRIQRWLPNVTTGETIIGGGGFGSSTYLYTQQIVFDENSNIYALEQYSNRIRFYTINKC